MPDQIEYVVCPLCAWNRALERKGSGALLSGSEKAKALLLEKGPKGKFRFGVLDPKAMPFILIRQAEGRGKGFTVQSSISLKQALAMPQYQELIDQARQAAKDFLAVVGDG